MSKFSVNLVVSLLSVIIAGLRGLLGIGKKIADIVDNGKIDGSYDCPPWMMNVEAGLEYASRALTCLEMASGFASVDESKMDDDNA